MGHSAVTCPVNLHPIFLFGKHGLVCDPEKKYGMQKAGSKKQRHCYSKREEAAWPDFFKVADPKKISGWPDKLE